jgi:hypothetical protein
MALLVLYVILTSVGPKDFVIYLVCLITNEKFTYFAS